MEEPQDRPIVTQYLMMKRSGLSKSRKTEIWEVRSRYGMFILGIIKWYTRWRQYVFFPEPDTVFNNQCMDEIMTRLSELNKEHSKNVRR